MHKKNYVPILCYVMSPSIWQECAGHQWTLHRIALVVRGWELAKLEEISELWTVKQTWFSYLLCTSATSIIWSLGDFWQISYAETSDFWQKYSNCLVIKKFLHLCNQVILHKPINTWKNEFLDERFTKKFTNRILHRYLIHTKDLAKDNDLICVPAYMTSLI